MTPGRRRHADALPQRWKARAVQCQKEISCNLPRLERGLGCAGKRVRQHILLARDVNRLHARPRPLAQKLPNLARDAVDALRLGDKLSGNSDRAGVVRTHQDELGDLRGCRRAEEAVLLGNKQRLKLRTVFAEVARLCGLRQRPSPSPRQCRRRRITHRHAIAARRCVGRDDENRVTAWNAPRAEHGVRVPKIHRAVGERVQLHRRGLRCGQMPAPPAQGFPYSPGNLHRGTPRCTTRRPYPSPLGVCLGAVQWSEGGPCPHDGELHVHQLADEGIDLPVRRKAQRGRARGFQDGVDGVDDVAAT